MAACDPLQHSVKPKCIKLYKMFPNLLQDRLDNIKLVVLAGWWRDKYVNRGTEKLEKLISYFKNHSNSTIMLLGTRPVPTIDPVRIVEQLDSRSIFKIERAFQAEMKHETAAENIFPAIARKHGVVFVSILDLMCRRDLHKNVKDRECITTDKKQKISIFTDFHHYNEFGSKVVAKKYRKQILAVLNK